MFGAFLVKDEEMNAGKSPSGAPWRNFYGRRYGKTLRHTQVAYLENDLTHPIQIVELIR